MLDKGKLHSAKTNDGLNLYLKKYEGKGLKEIMAEMEKEVLMSALEVYGSIPKVAQAFNVNRTTIFRKIKKIQANP